MYFQPLKDSGFVRASGNPSSATPGSKKVNIPEPVSRPKAFEKDGQLLVGMKHCFRSLSNRKYLASA